MKRALIAASLVIFLSTNLLGSQANAVEVRGVPDCALWAKDRSEDGWGATILETHMVATLNGLALATGRDFWIEGGEITNDQVYFWMDRHCANNPLKDIVDGTVELWFERFPE